MHVTHQYLLSVTTKQFHPSLVPRPPLFLPSVGVHNNTWERKTSEKRGKPRSIHHMSGREVDIGREGLIFKYICTKLESKFLTGQDK